MQISDFSIGRRTGFLGPRPKTGWDDDARIAGAAGLAHVLPGLIAEGTARQEIEKLACQDLGGWIAETGVSEHRALFRDVAMLVQAYVWADDGPVRVLPANLAVPMVVLADALGWPPILNYAAYVLDNCNQAEVPGAVRTFTGDPMEAGFLRIHFDVEMIGGRLAEAAMLALDAAAVGDEKRCGIQLERVASGLDAVNDRFTHMEEACSPAFFFRTLRHFWHGWMSNPALPDGLVYAGVDRLGGRPQKLRGIAGSQSSLMRMMDLLLGISHEANELTRYLGELDAYRPADHLRFLRALARHAGLKPMQRSDAPGVRSALDRCHAGISAFRTVHAEYAARYIADQQADRTGNEPDRGTGGTAFLQQLRAMRDSTRS